jgi:hypothetical protein
MAVKLLISGLSNTGKTTLTKDLQNALVINHDGKDYSLPIPHATIKEFSLASDMVTFITDKIEAYNNKFGDYPETIVIDSASRVFNSLYDACIGKYSGFDVYTTLDKEIKEFINFLELSLLESDINLVIISHAIFDDKTNRFIQVGKGNFSKTGGFTSIVDEAIFIDVNGTKRTIYYREPKYSARTFIDELPDKCKASEFNLQNHLDLLTKSSNSAAEYELQ